MQVTLAQLLEIDRSLLLPDSLEGMTLAEKIWAKHGCPTDARGLADVLDKIMQFCRREGIRYPPVILKRKKGLERGTWLPHAVRAWKPDTTPPSMTPSSTATCSLCGGRGYVPTDGGFSATLCPCGVFVKKSVSLPIKS
jgi:hypothetical protein